MRRKQLYERFWRGVLVLKPSDPALQYYRAAVESWLREEVAPASDAMAAKSGSVEICSANGASSPASSRRLGASPSSKEKLRAWASGAAGRCVAVEPGLQTPSQLCVAQNFVAFLTDKRELVQKRKPHRVAIGATPLAKKEIAS